MGLSSIGLVRSRGAEVQSGFESGTPRATGRSAVASGALLLASVVLVACASTRKAQAPPSQAKQDHVAGGQWSLRSAPGPKEVSARVSPRSLFLSSIGVRASPGLLALALEARTDTDLAPQVAAEWNQALLDPLVASRFDGVQKVGSKVSVRSLQERPDQSKPTVAQSLDSFVIDFLEPSVRSLVAERSELGPEQWEGFVHEVITTKTYSRGFDIASQVAEYKAGDCTEHAVLLAALLRASKIPARLVYGVVVVFSRQGVMAGGHAWTEYYDGKRWERLDAALYQSSQRAIQTDQGEGGQIFGVSSAAPSPSSKPATLSQSSAAPDSRSALGQDAAEEQRQPEAVIRRLYIPRFVLQNEGPGYARELSSGLQRSFSEVALSLRDE